MSQSVSLVLSSGGARGYAHVGVIEALENHGFTISSVTGCSMGAVVGGMYAAGGLDAFRQWACGLDRTDVFRLYDFVFSSQGLIRGEKVFKALETSIPDRNIEDLKIPFRAVATDLNKEKEVIFSSGSLYSALRASSAIPAVVKPAEVASLELLDGGILNPLPIDIAIRKPGDIIVAVNVNASIPYDPSHLSKKEIDEENHFRKQIEQMARKWLKKENNSNGAEKKKLGFFDLLLKSIDMMQDRITQHILRQYPPDILVQISRSAASTFDYHKACRLIEDGKRAFEHSLSAFEARETPVKPGPF